MQEQALRDGAFQSTPSAWRETSRRQCLYPCCGEFQSTPSAWRETRCAGGVFGKSTISIHSLRMEGDIRFDEILNPKWAFQSTPSAWRETESRGVLSVSERFQSTPSAWRETFRLRTSLDHQHISIHSLRMEGDIHRTNHGRRRIISIHSLRMEGDHLRQADTVHVVYFNPLPPHGGRLKRGYYFRSD